MALLDILQFPDPRLRIRADPVATVDDDVRRLIDDMLETMYEAAGIGLAAPQVGVSQRVIVLDVSEERQQPVCLINPVVLDSSGSQTIEEGCLSVPGFWEPVDRAARVRFTALDRNGAPFEREADGLLAVCILHEIDHLEGRLFVDYLSDLKRQRIRKKLEKQRQRM